MLFFVANSALPVEKSRIRCWHVALLILTLLCVFTTPGIAQSRSATIAAARSAMTTGVSAADAGHLAQAKRQFPPALALATQEPAVHASDRSVPHSMGE